MDQDNALIEYVELLVVMYEPYTDFLTEKERLLIQMLKTCIENVQVEQI